MFPGKCERRLASLRNKIRWLRPLAHLVLETTCKQGPSSCSSNCLLLSTSSRTYNPRYEPQSRGGRGEYLVVDGSNSETGRRLLSESRCPEGVSLYRQHPPSGLRFRLCDTFWLLRSHRQIEHTWTIPTRARIIMFTA